MCVCVCMRASVQNARDTEAKAAERKAAATSECAIESERNREIADGAFRAAPIHIADWDSSSLVRL